MGDPDALLEKFMSEANNNRSVTLQFFNVVFYITVLH